MLAGQTSRPHLKLSQSDVKTRWKHAKYSAEIKKTSNTLALLCRCKTISWPEMVVDSIMCIFSLCAKLSFIFSEYSLKMLNYYFKIHVLFLQY